MKSIRKSFFPYAAVFAVFLLINPASVFAQRGSRSGETIEIKLASPLPRSSPWGNILDRMASEWTRAANNEIRVRILHDAQEGGEEKMLSSLSSNNIQAALFTSFGLSAICPSILTLSVPFNIRTDAEFDYVFKEIQPLLDAEVNESSFTVIAWSKAGWVNVFSKEPVLTPDDLRKLKIASNAEAEDMNTVFKTMGFQVVETDWTDVGPKLNSGAVSAVYQQPVAVAAMQIHRMLNNMMSTPLAPAMGAIVLNKVTWNKISPASQQNILRIARRTAAEFDTTMPGTISNTVRTMSRSGLKVNQLSSSHEELWVGEIEKVMPSLLGSTFDPEVYTKINEALEEQRSSR